MSLERLIRLVTVVCIATFLATILWHLPWFVFLSSCCALFITGLLTARRYRGAERREGIFYVMAGLAFGALGLFLSPDAPFSDVGIMWFLVAFLILGFIALVILFLPGKIGGERKQS